MSCPQQFLCWQIPSLWQASSSHMKAAGVGHNSLFTVCPGHRTSWQVHVANLATWHPDLELQSPCSTTRLLPPITFFLYQSDHSPHRCTAILNITPGSSTQTNDIDCNGLPCEGASSSYLWFDINLNLKVWSQTGQEPADRFTRTSLELISVGV